MSPYQAWLDRKNKNMFNVELQYMVMYMDDLENVLRVYEYLKKFDSNSTYYIYAEKIDDEINATCFHINLSADKFDEIDNDLKIKMSVGKYNL